MTPVTQLGGASSASDSAVSCPEPDSQCLFSYNWGGYGVCDETTTACSDAFTSSPPTPTAGAVTFVTGTWNVPGMTGVNEPYNRNVNCSDSDNTWYDSSVWVGIDGLVDSTVEQTGTSSDCFYGQTTYYAWYEFYPSASESVPITVNAGDSIAASVTCSAGAQSGVAGAYCTTTITDNTDHQSYTSPSTFVPGALLNSAEWIQESAYYNGFLALTDVNTLTFTNTYATINHVTGSISSFGTHVYWLVMVDYNFPYGAVDHESFYVKAEPSALNYAGNSFTSTWVSNGP